MILQITDQYLTLTTFLSYLSVCFYYVFSRMCVLLITLALFSLHIGVISHYSTETALLHTMDSVFRSSDQGQPSLLVSLDISAAFDTIDHTILLNRLSVGFGVSGSVLTWLKSYTGRYQCVRVGQASSSHTLCHTGVPQGSVLGPILFSCYISPISFIANTFEELRAIN